MLKNNKKMILGILTKINNNNYNKKNKRLFKSNKYRSRNKKRKTLEILKNKTNKIKFNKITKTNKIMFKNHKKTLINLKVKNKNWNRNK